MKNKHTIWVTYLLFCLSVPTILAKNSNTDYDGTSRSNHVAVLSIPVIRSPSTQAKEIPSITHIPAEAKKSTIPWYMVTNETKTINGRDVPSMNVVPHLPKDILPIIVSCEWRWYPSRFNLDFWIPSSPGGQKMMKLLGYQQKAVAIAESLDEVSTDALFLIQILGPKLIRSRHTIRARMEFQEEWEDLTYKEVQAFVDATLWYRKSVHDAWKVLTRTGFDLGMMASELSYSGDYARSAYRSRSWEDMESSVVKGNMGPQRLNEKNQFESRRSIDSYGYPFEYWDLFCQGISRWFTAQIVQYQPIPPAEIRKDVIGSPPSRHPLPRGVAPTLPPLRRTGLSRFREELPKGMWVQPGFMQNDRWPVPIQIRRCGPSTSEVVFQIHNRLPVNVRIEVSSMVQNASPNPSRVDYERQELFLKPQKRDLLKVKMPLLDEDDTKTMKSDGWDEVYVFPIWSED
jgi:hypothetical protein